MTKQEVEAVVKHTGDVYKIKVKNEEAPRNFYISRVGQWYIEQTAGGGLEGEIIGFGRLESIEAF
jgi:hypothetical protein